MDLRQPLKTDSSDLAILRQALASVGAVAWQWDLDGNRFTCSQLLAEEMGLSVAGEPFNLLQRVSDEDIHTLFGLAQRAFEGNDTFEAVVHIELHNQPHPFRLIGSRVHRTIDNRRQLAGILLAGVDTGFLLNSIVNNSSILVYVKDLAGHYLFANRQYANLSGVSEQSILGKTDLELFDYAIAEQLQRFESWVAESGDSVQLEEQLPFKGHDSTYLASRFPIRNSQGEVYALGGVFTDITLNKSFETTIELQRQQLRQVIDALPAQIWQLNQWGEICELNENAAQALGLAVEAAKGQTVLEALPWWDDPAERHREILHVIRTGKPMLGSLESFEKDGHTYWLSVDKIPMVNTEGDTEQLLLVASDISEIKRNEQMLAQSIKEAKHAQLALQRSEARYRNFIENSHEGIFNYQIVPPVAINIPPEQQVQHILRGMLVQECNDEYARHIGFGRASAIEGKFFKELINVDIVTELIETFVGNNYRVARYELQGLARGNDELWLSTSVEGIIEEGLLVGCWGTQRNITERKKYLEELEYQATHDSLTLLPNRKKLYIEAEKAIECRLPDKSLALMLIDLDRFKEINDTLGHHMGDRLLKQLGPRLEAEIAEYEGLVARLGGDEFAVMLTDLNEEQALDQAAQILNAINQTFDLNGFKADISASIGISFCPKHGDDVGTLMRYADVAMYRAKTESLGTLEYSAEYDKHSPKRLTLMTDLGRAIRQDQLHLHFQPKLDLLGECICGFEALLRWTHPEHGMIPPGEFIHLAESTELIHPLTLWVLDAAVAQCRRWRDQGLDVVVSVNLSTRNLLDEQIVDHVRNALTRYGVPAAALELEITESSIMADPKRALMALQAVSSLGVYLSIDDFGTGYSSLAYLKRLPVNALKIDYSFVIDMLADEQDAIIVNSTINLAHNLGLNVVAEGVEGPEVLQRLTDMGCDQVQGYHIGRPMDDAQIANWLTLAPFNVKRL